jgi:hypothetical protein
MITTSMMTLETVFVTKIWFHFEVFQFRFFLCLHLMANADICVFVLQMLPSLVWFTLKDNLTHMIETIGSKIGHEKKV